MSAYQKKGFWIGILFFMGILALPTPADLSNTGWIVAAIATLMAIWWLLKQYLLLLLLYCH